MIDFYIGYIESFQNLTLKMPNNSSLKRTSDLETYQRGFMVKNEHIKRWSLLIRDMQMKKMMWSTPNDSKDTKC